jgi:hypothetical protein
VQAVIDQIAILLTGVPAVFLTQSRRESWRRFACLFGIAGQPFWIYAALSAKQWGIFLIALLYTAAWLKGVWTHWIRSVKP